MMLECFFFLSFCKNKQSPQTTSKSHFLGHLVVIESASEILKGFLGWEKLFSFSFNFAPHHSVMNFACEILLLMNELSAIKAAVN